jgi:FkbM family methyltransferase
VNVETGTQHEPRTTAGGEEGTSSSQVKFVRRLLITVCSLAALADFFYLGTAFGRHYEFQRLVYEMPAGENASAALRRVLRIQSSYGQYQQDLWVALAEAHGKKDGYYVDVGSADGEFISNTFLLDQMGWKGVCIDPFPKNMARRTCQVFKQPVFSESGKKLRFRAAGDLGGIESDLGKFKNELADAPTVEVVTATLDEILEKAKAPHWIDYMNIDVEGAEVDALRGLNLDRYEIGALTIEHNFEPEKRARIQQIMEAKGYVRVRSWEVDDYYVLKSLAGRYKTILTYASRPK